LREASLGTGFKWVAGLLEPSVSGGGGTGDVAWANGNIGSNNYVITANGDGSIVAESNMTFDGNALIVNGSLYVIGNVSIGGTTYTRNIQADPATPGNFFIQTQAGVASGNSVFCPTGDTGAGLGGYGSGGPTEVLELIINATKRIAVSNVGIHINGDCSISGDLYNLGMDNASTNDVVYYNTTTKKLTYATAPIGADISTLNIASYVNSSTYYDSSLMYRRMPNPSTGLSNSSSQGQYVNLVAGENITTNYAVCIRPDGKAYHANANASDYMPAVALNATGATISSGGSADFLVHGVAKVANSTYFQAGKPVYMYAGIAGYIYYSRPTAANSCVQVLGIAISNNSMIWNPSPDFIVLK
jgi:hypothetical protein